MQRWHQFKSPKLYKSFLLSHNNGFKHLKGTNMLVCHSDTSLTPWVLPVIYHLFFGKDFSQLRRSGRYFCSSLSTCMFNRRNHDIKLSDDDDESTKRLSFLLLFQKRPNMYHEHMLQKKVCQQETSSKPPLPNLRDAIFRWRPKA